MYKDGNRFVEKMKDRPFALLGINGDGDREKLRALLKKEQITWRSWWDGGGNANEVGPIAKRYNTHVWPTLYLLDHHGVIRHKFLGSPDAKRLESLIEPLVRAAEQDRG
jgi:hypothetical protein